MELINGYWIDENNNRWDAAFYSREQAENSSKKLSNCHNCIDCHDCCGCHDCRDCRNCHDCHDCYRCIFCWDCIHCYHCTFCLGCRDYTHNPRRYITDRLGNCNDQTTFYCGETKSGEDKIHVVCGCFRGNLEEFEAQVKETHGDNEHAKQYMAEIERVKALWKE